MNTLYSNLYDITEVQQKIVRYITYWVHVEKEPIPHIEIINEMERRGQKPKTVKLALKGLLRLGYIRRAISNGASESGFAGARRTRYVQQRTL